MVRPKSDIKQNKFIKIRVSEKFYDFIKEFSSRLGISVSECCRGALEIFFMAYYLGKVKEIDRAFYMKYKKYFDKVVGE
ncbi:MAG: hypothetical protein QW795_03465 [Candidatus Bathyarchaeia archaeon]